MTGESNNGNQPSYDDDYFESHTNDNRPKLLTHIEQVMNGIDPSEDIDDTVEKLEALLYYGEDDGFDWTKNSKKSMKDGFDWVDSSKQQSTVSSLDNKRKARGSTVNETKNQSVRSLESADDSIDDSDVSEWTRELDANESHGSQWDSKYSTLDNAKIHHRERTESFHQVHSSMQEYTKKESFELIKADHPKPHPKRDETKSKIHRRASTPTSSYKYQICLFIQMQLCSTTTLSDWIKQRNHDCLRFDSEEKQKRARPAFLIFRQIVNGLEHVHSKGIIHRDLKPAVSFTLLDIICVV